MTTLSRETMPERFKVPEQGVEFCFATVDGWAVEFDTFEQDADPSRLMAGLPDDACQSHHMGYVIEGTMTYTYTDGSVDEIPAGSAYYVRPGHTPKMTAGTRLVEFSPAAELAETMKVITANMEAEAEAAVPRGEAEGGAPVS